MRNTTNLSNKTNEIRDKILSTVRHLATMTMRLIETVSSQTKSTSAYRKVRLKRGSSLKRSVSSEIVVITLCLMCIISRVSSLEARNNRPPRFLIDNQHSEIVLRLKEGPDTPVGELKQGSGFLQFFPLRRILINRQFNLQTQGLRSRWRRFGLWRSKYIR